MGKIDPYREIELIRIESQEHTRILKDISSRLGLLWKKLEGDMWMSKYEKDRY